MDASTTNNSNNAKQQQQQQQKDEAWDYRQPGVTPEILSHRVRFLNSTRCSALLQHIYDQQRINPTAEATDLNTKYGACLMNGLSQKLRMCLNSVSHTLSSPLVSQTEISAIERCFAAQRNQQEVTEISNRIASAFSADVTENDSDNSYEGLSKMKALVESRSMTQVTEPTAESDSAVSQPPPITEKIVNFGRAQHSDCQTEFEALQMCSKQPSHTRDDWTCFVPQQRFSMCMKSALCAHTVASCKQRLLQQHPNPNEKQEAQALMYCLTNDDAASACLQEINEINSNVSTVPLSSDLYSQYAYQLLETAQVAEEPRESSGLAVTVQSLRAEKRLKQQRLKNERAEFDGVTASDYEYAKKCESVKINECSEEFEAAFECSSGRGRVVGSGEECMDPIIRLGVCSTTHVCAKALRRCIGRANTTHGSAERAFEWCLENDENVRLCSARVHNENVRRHRKAYNGE